MIIFLLGSGEAIKIFIIYIKIDWTHKIFLGNFIRCKILIRQHFKVVGRTKHCTQILGTLLVINFGLNEVAITEIQLNPVAGLA